MSHIHHSARDGFSAAARTYSSGRPDYPEALSGWLQGALGLGPGMLAVDLGAGTGKFLPRLQATGATIVAVEPLAEMAAILKVEHPRVEVRDGSAEALPFANESVDGIVCAQSFHWFANSRALAEIRRALKPGGVLGLVWNRRDARIGWVAALNAILAPYAGDAPRAISDAWRAAFPAPGFGALEESVFPHHQVGPAEVVIVENSLSVSFIAALPRGERDKVAMRIRALVTATPELAHGEASFPYRTHAFRCAKMS